MLSSASAVAAAGTAAAHNEVPIQIAANGAVLASLCVNIPIIIYRIGLCALGAAVIIAVAIVVWHEYPGKAGLFWVPHEHFFQLKTP
jgi:hypothetical protein